MPDHLSSATLSSCSQREASLPPSLPRCRRWNRECQREQSGPPCPLAGLVAHHFIQVPRTTCSSISNPSTMLEPKFHRRFTGLHSVDSISYLHPPDPGVSNLGGHHGQVQGRQHLQDSIHKCIKSAGNDCGFWGSSSPTRASGCSIDSICVTGRAACVCSDFTPVLSDYFKHFLRIKHIQCRPCEQQAKHISTYIGQPLAR